jgi:hypothetical protein
MRILSANSSAREKILNSNRITKSEVIGRNQGDHAVVSLFGQSTVAPRAVVNDQAVKAGDVTSSFRDAHIAIAKDNSPELPGRVMTSSSRGVCAATAMDGRAVPTVAPIGLMEADDRVANAGHTTPSSRGVCAATAMDGRAVPTMAPIGLMESDDRLASAGHTTISSRGVCAATVMDGRAVPTVAPIGLIKSNVLATKAQNMTLSSLGVCAATAMDGRTVPTVAPIGLMKSILPNSSMSSSSSSQDNRVSQFNALPSHSHNRDNVKNGQQTEAKEPALAKKRARELSNSTRAKWSPEIQTATIAEMTTRFKAMFPGVLTPSMTKDAEALILAAYEAADISFGIKEAAAWGDSVPQWGGIGDKIVEQDEAIIRSCGFSLEKAATAKMAPDLPNRLSVDRVLNLLPDNPERERLLSIVGGVKVIVPPDFVPNGSGDIIPPLRRKYELGAPAVNRSNFETYVKKNRALLISKSFATEHFLRQHCLGASPVFATGMGSQQKSCRKTNHRLQRWRIST